MNQITNQSDMGKLSTISDVPKSIYTVGNVELLNKEGYKTICIVGSRRYSSYGHDVTRGIVESLKDYKVIIVSGLALGLDTVVHHSTLDHGIPCIAVPASGLNEDVLYPRTNVELTQKIVEKGGLLLTEYEPDFRATPWSFPHRNRIMAGLSDATIIIEAESDSGTLFTAKLAHDYGRKVLAVPSSIFSPTGEGCNKMIQNGKAQIITSREDVAELLGLELK
jgi:DNA processing protein